LVEKVEELREVEATASDVYPVTERSRGAGHTSLAVASTSLN
jgi:hypothetical protein